MIADRPKRIGDLHKQVVVIMKNHGFLAVHNPGGVDNCTAKRLSDGLMTQAYAQDWSDTRTLTDQLDGYPGGRRGAGPR